MPALDPLLVCIAAAALVLLAHGIFALARHNSGDGEPGAIAEGVATLLCGLAFIGPLATVPFAADLTEALILLGTVCAVVASSLPIVVLRRRRVTAEPAEMPLIVNRRVIRRRAPSGRTRRVVRRGTDPAEVVRSSTTGPIPRIPFSSERPARRTEEANRSVAGPIRWTPPEVPVPVPEEAPAETAADPPVPTEVREVEQATKALDEVDHTVLDVKAWLRLDR